MKKEEFIQAPPAQSKLIIVAGVTHIGQWEVWRCPDDVIALSWYAATQDEEPWMLPVFSRVLSLTDAAGLGEALSVLSRSSAEGAP